MLIRLFLLFALLPIVSSTEPPVTTGNREVFLGDKFAARYNSWATIRTQRQKDLIDAREIRAWHETQQAWKALNREVQY